MQVDVNEVVKKLSQRIAQLEVDKAILQCQLELKEKESAE